MPRMEVKGVIMRRLAPGADLLEELNKLAREEGIELGEVSGIGALRRAAVGIFVPEAREYKVHTYDEQTELCVLAGNISLKDGEPFVHAHVSLTDTEGRGLGGHVMPGCEIFVAEVVVWEFEGPRLEREPQEECGGLALWAAENVGIE